MAEIFLVNFKPYFTSTQLISPSSSQNIEPYRAALSLSSSPPHSLFNPSLALPLSAVASSASLLWMLIVARSLFAVIVRSLSLYVVVAHSLLLMLAVASSLSVVVACSLLRRELALPPSSGCSPDTPNSMIKRGQRNEAENQLRRIRGVDDVKEEFGDLILASDESKKIENPLRNLRQRKYRPQLCMAIMIPFFQQFTGINVIMFYALVLFNTIGFGGGKQSELATEEGASDDNRESS
ncbi:hypothetical protein ACLB2K_027122 [Fragaria x ananassa]